MGQNNTCMFETQIARGISIKKEIDEEIKPKINPLKYIQPRQITFDEPDDEKDHFHFLNNTEQSFVDDGLIDIPNIEKSRRIILSEIEDPSKQKPSIEEKNNNSEAVIKKVAVTWDKFIKMKSKKFTDDYDVYEEIGRGGFGAVYKVLIKNSHPPIFRAAKKIMKQNLKKDEHESLLEEMAIMMSLDHPNITKLYEVYQQSQYYVMVLQLCEGGELFDRIARNDIKESQAKNIMMQVLSALNYLHSLGIVHRDIKPENMLFEKKTKLIKIIDFGISKKIKPGEHLSSRVGTPYYIAPEVLLKKYDNKCDLWSLGVVLYMMIFKKPPFRGSDPVEVMRNVLTQDIHYSNFRSTGFSLLAFDMLSNLLKKNTNERFSAKKALEHEWLAKKKTFSKNFTDEHKKQALIRMTKFHFKNKLQAVVHTYIVSQLLTSEQRLQLLDLFHQLDSDKNGVVDKNQLHRSLIFKKFPLIPEKKLQKIIDYIDTNCSGNIDYTQFLVSSIDFKQKVKQKHFQQAFDYFDIDKNGSITYDEISQYLAGQNSEINQQQIKQLFHLVDKNGDGVISKEEFVELLVNNDQLDTYRS